MVTLFDKLAEYKESDYYPYHMPGHKRLGCGSLPDSIAGLDITEIDGFDNLHDPESLFCELQCKASKIFGAEESFYLVNGSTCGILAAISTVVPKDGHILMARGSHKSAYHAAYLRNLKISYIYSPVIDELDICDAILPSQVEKFLSENNNISAVFIVSPTYEGRISDVESIAKVVHKYGIPLIVDEAHGSHLGMAEGFANNSCRLGADIVIHSLHKTLPALTQSAMIHVNGNMVDRDKLKRYLRIYQSSSPSYILMSGIDNAINLIAEKKLDFVYFRKRYLQMMKELSECRVLKFLQADKNQDIGKLVISAKSVGVSGREIFDLLLNRYHLQPEMASAGHCLAMFTVCDGEEAYRRMTDALLKIDRELAEHVKFDKIDSVIPCSVTELISDSGNEGIELYKAWDGECVTIGLQDAIGRYAGEFVNLYPPGVPLLVPGERVSRKLAEYIPQYVVQGLNVQGIEVDEKSGECFIKVLSD